MSRLENYYALLGVPVDADVELITKAYRRRALELHPDKNSPAAPTNTSFQLLSEAYQTLKDEESRRQYDKMQQVALTSQGPARIAAELDLDEMEELTSNDGFTYWRSSCRCGDYYSITEMQLDEGQDTVQCPSCSLVIRVLYSPLDPS
eukprot:TRINITY_DN11080_c0_g1_i1.p1 TRINITY_DN11080_c0_g1~~TRINITY_DN11080_c0_g1_i1.p1  ORF type:complete len:148 (-),score=7.84 TRINITY_DN11080_c0_g1_i1:37-480(-)